MCTSFRCELGEGNAALVCCGAGLRRSLRGTGITQQRRGNATDKRGVAPKFRHGTKGWMRL